jgi:hypothetical protein
VPIDIDGGTAQHRRVLEEIFGRFGPTGIRRLAIGRHDVRPVPGDLPTPEQARKHSGVSLQLVEPASASHRVQWEAALVANAFRAATEDEEVEQVVLVRMPKSAWALSGATRPEPPLSTAELQRMPTDVEAAVAAAGAALEYLDIVQPYGHGFALQVDVTEPHAFLRERFATFDMAIRPWRNRCGHQVYLEVRDGRDDPVLISAAYGNGGASSMRSDVACCDPFVRIGTSMFRSPVSACPVFG